MDNIYVAKTSAVVVIDGRMRHLRAKETTVREGHPLLDSHPQYFKRLVVDFDVEQAAEESGDGEPPVRTATAAPGEKQPATRGSRSKK